MIKRLNPLNWLARAIDASDRLVAVLDGWTARMDYSGRHWATA